VPTEDQRLLVERLAAFNISEDAICAELSRGDGPACRSRTTLRRTFKQELALGRERMVNLLGHKLLDIALSDRPNNLTAISMLLRAIGGPMWREAKANTERDARPAEPVNVVTEDGETIAVTNSVMFRMPSNGRDRPEVLVTPPTINAEVAEAPAETAASEAGPALEDLQQMEPGKRRQIAI
jgi:hypothetical protein